MRRPLRTLVPGFGLRGARTAKRVEAWASEARRVRLGAGTPPVPAPGPRSLRILTDTTFQQALPWLGISTALATALTLRGHAVTGLRCDGLLSQCEHTLGRRPQPSCARCSRSMQSAEHAVALTAIGTGTLVTNADRAMAERTIAGTPDAALTGLVVDGIPLGRLAARELQRFARGAVPDPAADPAYRAWLVTAHLLSTLMDRALDEVRPDLVFATNGRILPAALLTARARSRGVRVVTWDTEPTHPDALVFSHGGEAAVVPLDDAWEPARRQPLTEAQRGALHAFAARWASAHHPVRGRLPAGLRPGARLVVAFSNSAWDMAAVDRDVAFHSMFDWLDAVVETARRHPDVDVVIRAHPAERAATADLWSRTPVPATLRARHGSIPTNLHLVDAADPVDTYALLARATVAMVYSSRIGLEAALAGLRPWIAGATTFRDKGFSRDLTGADDVDAACAVTTRDALTPEEQALAERFAYLWWFRALVRVPWLCDGHRVMPVPEPARLAPGGDPVIDRLCEAIATGTPFTDLC